MQPTRGRGRPTVEAEHLEEIRQLSADFRLTIHEVRRALQLLTYAQMHQEPLESRAIVEQVLSKLEALDGEIGWIAALSMEGQLPNLDPNKRTINAVRKREQE